MRQNLSPLPETRIEYHRRLGGDVQLQITEDAIILAEVQSEQHPTVMVSNLQCLSKIARIPSHANYCLFDPYTLATHLVRICGPRLCQNVPSFY